MRQNVPIPHALQMAVAHHQAGRLEDAEQIYRQILIAEPNNTDALHLLGLARHQAGNSESAAELIEKAHRLAPPQAFSLNSLGMAYLDLKRPEEAKKCFNRALKLQPDYAEAHNNLGAAFKALGELEQAARCYRRAVAIKPEYVDGHYNLGNVLAEMGRLDEAEQSYRHALAIKPDYAEAHNNLGTLLESMGRGEEAERSYRGALAFNSRLAEAHSNLGTLLKSFGRHGEAEQCFRRATALSPETPEFLFYLGQLLFDLGKVEEAEQCYRQTLALNSDFAGARWALTVSGLPRLCSADGSALPEIRKLSDWFESNRAADASEAVGILQPFYLAYLETDNRDVLSEYGVLCVRLMQRWRDVQRLKPIERVPADHIRVGIVSAQIRDHSVWNAIVKGWLRHLDRARFEPFVVSLGPKPDQETLLAKSLVSDFAQGGSRLRPNVDAILGWHPDVLIYPEIGMDAMTLKLASLRLAPVQIATWGHPETTGLPTIDYYLSAEDLEPDGAQENYTEKLVTLPHLGCCYSPLAVTAVDADLAALGIESNVPILLCPGTPFKYAPEHDQVFTEIARRLGPSQFVFFTLFPQYLSEVLRGRLRDAFSRAGMEFERYVVFIPKQPPPAFYGLMRRADVFLDTIGFSGFNTAMQAVECGLPIVTREGRFLRGRLASGILKRIGLQELVAASEENYVELAVKLARDASYRQDVRTRMEASRSVLYEDLAPIRALEDFLLKATKPGRECVA